jgi:hypothetical protein
LALRGAHHLGIHRMCIELEIKVRHGFTW